MALGSFNAILRLTYQLLCERELRIEMCGKPERITYDYSMRIAQQAAGENATVSQYYMIGDNPSSDICGANRVGIPSVLVRTGIWDKEENSTENPATHMTDDFSDAVDLILRLEGIELQE